MNEEQLTMLMWKCFFFDYCNNNNNNNNNDKFSLSNSYLVVTKLIFHGTRRTLLNDNGDGECLLSSTNLLLTHRRLRPYKTGPLNCRMLLTANSGQWNVDCDRRARGLAIGECARV